MSQEKVIQTFQKKYDTLAMKVNNYIKSIEPYNYYDTDMYANVFNSQRCEHFQQRLRYVQEGLERYHRNKDDLSSELIEAGNKWIKCELKSIDVDFEKFRDFVYDKRQESHFRPTVSVL
jgi:hypothetical protein